MPKAITTTEYSNIISAPLPEHRSTYTVIPHATIIDKVRTELANHGFDIKKESYKSTHNSQIATAKYDLVSHGDEDMGMMFAWVNSYDKSTTFKCATGGNVFVCTNGMIHGDMFKFNRKHTGNALEEAIAAITHQITGAQVQYEVLLEAKRLLKDITLSPRRAAELVGYMYADRNILTTTQVALVKQEMKKPSFDYNANKESAWPFYNHITHALKLTHPEKWMDRHAEVDGIIMAELASYN